MVIADVTSPQNNLEHYAGGTSGTSFSHILSGDFLGTVGHDYVVKLENLGSTSFALSNQVSQWNLHKVPFT
jgi:hypothetical protein